MWHCSHTLWHSATDLNSPSGIVWAGTVAEYMAYVHTIPYNTTHYNSSMGSLTVQYIQHAVSFTFVQRKCEEVAV